MSIIDITSNQAYATISDAITRSASGDVIAVTAGRYVEDFPIITHTLTIQGVGGMAQLSTPSPTPGNGRAILYVGGNAGADLTVRNLELSGARDPASNGAGILFEVGNGNLAISNAWFHDNQDGILVGVQPAGTVTVDHSEFNNNGLDPTDPRYGLSHNLYVGDVASLTITRSYFHDALGGHEVKSRAAKTVITDNRIQDGPVAPASYDIDLPDGGQAIVTGNVIEKGASAQNRYAVHFGGETPIYGNSNLILQDNVFINDRAGATVLLNATVGPGSQSFPVTVTGNTAYGFDDLYQNRNPPSVAPGDMIQGNLLLATGAPSLDSSAPFDTPEPASAGLFGLAMLAAAVLRRRRVRQR